MTNGARPPLTIAVEGDTDVAVVRRVVAAAGREVAYEYPTGGKGRLDRQLSGYNSAARFSPWLVIRDLNGDADCAPAYIAANLPEPSEKMRFRICVRSIESWLLADRANLAAYLVVSAAHIPPNPETLANPKVAMVSTAAKSRSRLIREDMVPQPGISSAVGPGYVARLIEFAGMRWDPVSAAANSDSLARCLRSLGTL